MRPLEPLHTPRTQKSGMLRNRAKAPNPSPSLTGKVQIQLAPKLCRFLFNPFLRAPAFPALSSSLSKHRYQHNGYNSRWPLLYLTSFWCWRYHRCRSRTLSQPTSSGRAGTRCLKSTYHRIPSVYPNAPLTGNRSTSSTSPTKATHSNSQAPDPLFPTRARLA